jgi:hypothetical protein
MYDGWVRAIAVALSILAVPGCGSSPEGGETTGSDPCAPAAWIEITKLTGGAGDVIAGKYVDAEGGLVGDSTVSKFFQVTTTSPPFHVAINIDSDDATTGSKSASNGVPKVGQRSFTIRVDHHEYGDAYGQSGGQFVVTANPAQKCDPFEAEFTDLALLWESCSDDPAPCGPHDDLVITGSFHGIARTWP